jgi:hypothetical protein
VTGGAGADAAPPVTTADKLLVTASDSDRYRAVAAPSAPVSTHRIYHDLSYLSLPPSPVLSPFLPLLFYISLYHLFSHLFSLIFAIYLESMNVGQHCTSLIP